jgi:2-amino-4-hydroxy-6-hydroxymethyldihydropteridine diphosphokinase
VLDGDGLALLAQSPTITSRPLGPSQRIYANAAALVETVLDPPALLARLKSIEHAFGRRARGRRWSSRVLDLDIILWSGGIWSERNLSIPHPEFRRRQFVLQPASRIAPQWRDPTCAFTLRQLAARLDREGRPVLA